MATVAVGGVKNLRKHLDSVEERSGKEVNEALRDKVAEPVARRVRSQVPRSNITRRGGRKKHHWQDKIKAGGNAQGAYVRWYAEKSVPYAPWIEFGGTIEQPARGVSLTRRHVKEGRYVFPEVKRSADQAARTAERVLNGLID